MTSEIRSILKTCSTCKETFSTLRDLINHENEHRRIARVIASSSTVRVENSTNHSPSTSAAPSAATSLLSRGNHSISSSSNAVRPLLEKDVDAEEFRGAISDNSSDNSSELFAEADVSSDDDQNDANTSNSYEPSLAFFYRFSPSNKSGRNERRLGSVEGSDGTVYSPAEAGDYDGKAAQATSNSDRWLCKYCLGVFSTRQVLVSASHQSRLHESADGTLLHYCYKCSRVRRNGRRTYFESRDQFLAHLETRHGIARTIVEEATNDGELISREIENSGLMGPSNSEIDGKSESETSNSNPAHGSANAGVANTGWTLDHARIPPSFVSRFPKPLGKKTYNRAQGLVTCKYCLGSFVGIAALRLHQERLHFHEEGKPGYFCRICSGKGRNSRPIYFSSKKELQRHATEEHGFGGRNDKTRANKQFRSVNSEKVSTSARATGTFASSKTMSIERGEQSNEVKAKNICKYCRGAFSCSRYLERHERYYHYAADGNVRYYCSVCTGRSVRFKLYFQNEEEFWDHMMQKHGIVDMDSGSGEQEAACAQLGNKETSKDKSIGKLEPGTESEKFSKKPKKEVNDPCEVPYPGDSVTSATTDRGNCGNSNVLDPNMTTSAWTTVVKMETAESETANIGNDLVLPDFVDVKTEPVDGS